MSNIYRPSGATLPEQYENVGSLFSKALNKPIELDERKVQLVQRVLAKVARTKELNLFYECFKSWAKGAGITEEKAMYLLADNTSGCQTAIVRYGSGVALLHTEEDYYDVSERMKGAHTIQFIEQGRVLNTLVYNDLMPGAGLYGWQKDVLVAVDSLFLREDGIFEIETPMLANIIAWLIWHKNPEHLEPSKLIDELKKLGTVIDGYAINIVRKNKEIIEGYKLTFARNDWEVEWLNERVGDNLRQVNIVEPKYARAHKKVAKWRHAPWKMAVDYYGFLKRLRTMKQHIEANQQWINHTLPLEKVEQVHKAIQQLIFTKYNHDYVTEWMGAMCVGLLDLHSTSVSTRLHKKPDYGILEYVDIIA